MQLNEKIKSIILELSSEDAYASWELFGAVNQDITRKYEIHKDQLRAKFLDMFAELIKDEKLIALSHKSLDHSYKEVSSDKERLNCETNQADKSDQDTFYWFEATEEGKREDIFIRSLI